MEEQNVHSILLVYSGEEFCVVCCVLHLLYLPSPPACGNYVIFLAGAPHLLAEVDEINHSFRGRYLG